MKLITFSILFILFMALSSCEENVNKNIILESRSREYSNTIGSYTTKIKKNEWNHDQTAVLISDMWRKHWCDGVNRRNAVLSQRINKFVAVARDRGMLIIHIPSGGLKFYENHPARLRAKNMPHPASYPQDIEKELTALAGEKRNEWPIHSAKGGCDCTPQCPGSNTMDRRQIETIEIRDNDIISGSSD